MRQCTTCKEFKELDEFYKSKDKKSGYRSSCKKCSNIKCIEYYENNKDKKREYFLLNKDRINEYQKGYRKEYYILNKDNINKKVKEYYYKNKEKTFYRKRKYRRFRYYNDPVYRCRVLITSNIKRALKERSFEKNCRTKDILGCSFKEFKGYLESKFETWMNWNNHGLYNGEFNYGWDIDHIVPSSVAKTEEEVYRLNHHTNLQPLCSKYNRDIKKDNLL